MLAGFNVIFLVLFLGMVGAWLIKALSEEKGTATSEEETKKQEKTGAWALTERTVFLALFFLALLLRVWKFGVIPGGMNQDGAMAAVDAMALSKYGTDRFGMLLPTHFTGWGFAQMNVFMSYCMIPFFKLFGMNVMTTRLPVLFFSMLGLIALYFVGRRLLGVRGAQILLAFAVCNPWHFMQSRWALESNMLPHVFLIGFCLLLMGLQEKKRWLYLSMVFFALSMYCYGIAFYTVPVFLLFMAGYLLVKKLLKWREALLCVVIYVMISWPIYLTMAINAFGWKTIRTFFCTMPYFADSVRAKDLIFFSEHPGGQLEINLEAIRRVYLEGDGLPWNTMNGIGVMTTCFLPFAFLGLLSCIIRLRGEENPIRKAGHVALLAIFSIANLSGIITAQVNVNRINLLHYFLLILVAYGIDQLIQDGKKAKYVILAAYLIISILFLRTYFTEHAKTLEKYYYHDFLEAVRFAGNEEESGCVRIMITPDTQYSGARTVSEILTMYALSIDSKYYQGIGVDEHGLSYAEKYRYENPSPRDMNPDEPVAYVIRTAALTPYVMAELEGNGTDGYGITNFGDYCVAVPWKFLY